MSARKIEALGKLGEWIKENPDPLELAVLKSKRDNAWFDLKNQRNALQAISNHYLNPQEIEDWVSQYPDLGTSTPKRVGLITAGNIPAVGFHDLLCIYLSGHKAIVKLSDKDAHLLPALFKQLGNFIEGVKKQIQFVDKFDDIEALIATGSDNSKRYFEHYFGHLPHIIRGNRNSLAIISEDVSEEYLQRLGNDIFDYYGLGCRSVSQILIPSAYNENKLLDAWEDFQYVMDNTKYENNFKYNYATAILNREVFKTNNFLLLKEHPDLISRIACLHYARYDGIEEAYSYLNQYSSKIQVCVTDMELNNTDIPTTKPGNSQQPSLNDYADRIDTLNFLKNL